MTLVGVKRVNREVERSHLDAEAHRDELLHETKEGNVVSHPPDRVLRAHVHRGVQLVVTDAEVQPIGAGNVQRAQRKVTRLQDDRAGPPRVGVRSELFDAPKQLALSKEVVTVVGVDLAGVVAQGCPELGVLVNRSVPWVPAEVPPKLGLDVLE